MDYLYLVNPPWVVCGCLEIIKYSKIVLFIPKSLIFRLEN